MFFYNTFKKLPEGAKVSVERQAFMNSFQGRITELYEEARDKDPSIGRAAFARKCGITKGQLNGYIDGNFAKVCQTLRSIASANNVSVSWLVGEVQERVNTHGIFQEMLEGLSPEDLATVRKIAESLKLKSEHNKAK